MRYITAIAFVFFNLFACKEFRCREFYRRYEWCTQGSNRQWQEEEMAWVEWCDQAPAPLLQLDCTIRSTCNEFLKCVDNK